MTFREAFGRELARQLHRQIIGTMLAAVLFQIVYWLLERIEKDRGRRFLRGVAWAAAGGTHSKAESAQREQ